MNHATNSAIMRLSNRKLILNMIRLTPISRVELAENVQLTRASVTQIIDELLEAGLVEPCDDSRELRETGVLGRRRTLLTLKHRARFAYGLHITRHKCCVGIVDLYGDVETEQEITITDMSPEEVADTLADIMGKQQAQCAIPKEAILGIGVSAPGPLDYQNGIIINPPNFETWHNTPICEMLRERTGLQVHLEKDTNARALEEMYFGAAKDFSSFMLVQIDEGVGSGVVINNTLYRGSNGMGSEIGHTTIDYNGPQCSCGNRGCLEGYVSIPSLLKGSPFISWQEMAEYAVSSGIQNRISAETDTPAKTAAGAKLLDQAADYLTAALVNAVNLYDLQKIILTGEVALFPDPLLERVNALLADRVISRSSLQENPVISSRNIAPIRTGAMAALCDFFQGRS